MKNYQLHFMPNKISLTNKIPSNILVCWKEQDTLNYIVKLYNQERFSGLLTSEELGIPHRLDLSIPLIFICCLFDFINNILKLLFSIDAFYS